MHYRKDGRCSIYEKKSESSSADQALTTIKCDKRFGVHSNGPIPDVTQS